MEKTAYERTTSLSRQKILYEDIIISTIGFFGRSQFILLLTCILLKIFASWAHVMVSFSTVPDWWYLGRNNETVNNMTLENKNNCSEYENSTVSNIYFQKDDTFVSEWKLVCAEEYIIKYITLLQLVGSVSGAAIIGHLGDKYGRKDGMVFSYVIMLTFMCIEGFSMNWYVLTMCRCFLGFSVAGVLVISQVYLLEFLGNGWRYKVMAIPTWQIGLFILGITSQIITNWRVITKTLAFIGLPIVVLFYFCPESLRWMFVQNRIDDGKRILQKMAESNKQREFDIPNFDIEIAKDVVKAKRYQLKYNGVSLFKKKLTRRKLFYLIILWYTMSFGYFANTYKVHKLNSGSINLIVMGMVESLARALLYAVIIRFGKRRCTSVTFASVAVSSFIVSVTFIVVNDQNNLLLNIFIWTSRTLCSAVTFSVILFTAETFPTVVRSSALGIGYLFYYLGAIIALEVKNTKIQPHAPFTALTVLSILSAFACLTFKDKDKKHLQDYLAEK